MEPHRVTVDRRTTTPDSSSESASQTRFVAAEPMVGPAGRERRLASGRGRGGVGAISVPGRRTPWFLAVCALAALWPATPAGAQERIGPREDYAGIAAVLEQFIAHEMRDKGLPAVSVAQIGRAHV